MLLSKQTGDVRCQNRLLEVAESEVTSSERGIQRAGLKEIVGKQVAEARTSFEEVLQKQFTIMPRHYTGTSRLERKAVRS